MKSYWLLLLTISLKYLKITAYLSNLTCIVVPQSFCEVQDLNYLKGQVFVINQNEGQKIHITKSLIYTIRLAETNISEFWAIDLGIEDILDSKPDKENKSSLTVLSLAKNNIKRLDKNCFAAIPNLRQLYIGQNQINYIEKSVFQGMESLRVISLSGNDLLELDLNLFKDVPNLRKLFLSSNKLAQLDIDLGKIELFQKVCVKHNNLRLLKIKQDDIENCNVLKVKIAGNHYLEKLSLINFPMFVLDQGIFNNSTLKYFLIALVCVSVLAIIFFIAIIWMGIRLCKVKKVEPTAPGSSDVGYYCSAYYSGVPDTPQRVEGRYDTLAYNNND